MNENKRTRNLAEGETNDEYDGEEVGNYSKYTMLDEGVDDDEKEEIEDKKELEEVLYRFLNPYYFKTLRSDGKINFYDEACYKCNYAQFANNYFLKLHIYEYHSENNEPIKYKCLNENCTEVFDTRIERHKHSKEEYELKFNVNNLIKYGVTGNLYDRFYDMYHTQLEQRMLRLASIPRISSRSYNREDHERAKRTREKTLLREQEDEAYYNAIIETIDYACLDRLQHEGKVKFCETHCCTCTKQFISHHWYKLHSNENHKEEAPVKFNCFKELCDKKFDTLKERDSHCREDHKLKFDVNEFLKNGLHRSVYHKIERKYSFDQTKHPNTTKKKEEDEQVEEIVYKMSNLMKPRSVIMKEKNDK